MGEQVDLELADAFVGFLPRFKLWLERLVPTGGPTAARIRLLGTVSCIGPQKMSELASALAITARRVTALVDALEDEGLVTRTPDARDRRVTWVGLTDSGVAVVDRVYQAHRESIAGLFDGLAPERKSELLHAVRELTERLGRADSDARRAAGVAV
jgi:DNA-binding MarR family transcriptional regulator